MNKRTEPQFVGILKTYTQDKPIYTFAAEIPYYTLMHWLTNINACVTIFPKSFRAVRNQAKEMPVYPSWVRQDKTAIEKTSEPACDQIWEAMAKAGCMAADGLESIGVHQDIARVCVNPFTTCTVLITTNELPSELANVRFNQVVDLPSKNPAFHIPFWGNDPDIDPITKNKSEAWIAKSILKLNSVLQVAPQNPMNSLSDMYRAARKAYTDMPELAKHILTIKYKGAGLPSLFGSDWVNYRDIMQAQFEDPLHFQKPYYFDI